MSTISFLRIALIFPPQFVYRVGVLCNKQEKKQG